MGELRKDPILGRWVIIATERSKRPDVFTSKAQGMPRDDIDKCPFCEGREKMTPSEIFSLRDRQTSADEPGWRIRVVPNKFPALRLEQELKKRGYGVHDMMTDFGAHEIVIDTPDHRREMYFL